MRSRQEYIDLIKQHQAELLRFGVRSLTLFGSVARGEQHEGSDVDIFVDMPPRFLVACAVADYLEDILGCKVDLVRRHKRLSEFFLNQIKKDGIQVFTTT